MTGVWCLAQIVDDPLHFLACLHEGHRIGRRARGPGLVLAVLLAHGGGG